MKMKVLSVVILPLLIITGCATTSGLTPEQMDIVYQYNYQQSIKEGNSPRSAKVVADSAVKVFKMGAWANSDKTAVQAQIDKMKQSL